MCASSCRSREPNQWQFPETQLSHIGAQHCGRHVEKTKRKSLQAKAENFCTHHTSTHHSPKYPNIPPCVMFQPTPISRLCVFPYVFSGIRPCYVPNAKSFAAFASAPSRCCRRRRPQRAAIRVRASFVAPLAAAAAQWPPAAPSPRPSAIAAPAQHPAASLRARTFSNALPNACGTRRTEPACHSDAAPTTLRLILVALRLHLLIALVNKYKKLYLYLTCAVFVFVSSFFNRNIIVTKLSLVLAHFKLNIRLSKGYFAQWHYFYKILLAEIAFLPAFTYLFCLYSNQR